MSTLALSALAAGSLTVFGFCAAMGYCSLGDSDLPMGCVGFVLSFFFGALSGGVAAASWNGLVGRGNPLALTVSAVVPCVATFLFYRWLRGDTY